jgi:hypothetical protein
MIRRKSVLDRVTFTDLRLHCVTMPTPVWRQCVGEGCRPAAVMRSVGEITKQMVSWAYTKMADVTEPGFRKYWRQMPSSLKSQCHDITNKNTEAAPAVKQVYKMLSDTEVRAKCTPAKVQESSEWTTIVRSAEENRANFCKILEGKPNFSAL